MPQFVIRTNDPMQPIGTTSTVPERHQTLLAMIA